MNVFDVFGFKWGDVIVIDMFMNVYVVIVYLGIIFVGCIVVCIFDSFVVNEIVVCIWIFKFKVIFI